MIPVDNGRSHIIVASLYGIAGASANQSEYEENKRITIAATLRMAQIGTVPYFIGMDVNIDPAKSEAIQKSREAKLAFLALAEEILHRLSAEMVSTKE